MHTKSTVSLASIRLALPDVAPLYERLLTRFFRQCAAKTTTSVREDDLMAHSLLEHGTFNRRSRLRFGRGCGPAGRLEDDRSFIPCDEPRAEIVR